MNVYCFPALVSCLCSLFTPQTRASSQGFKPLGAGNLSLEGCLQPWLFVPVFQSPCCHPILHAAFYFSDHRSVYSTKNLLLLLIRIYIICISPCKWIAAFQLHCIKCKKTIIIIPQSELILEVCSSSPRYALQSADRFLLFFCFEGQKHCANKEWAERCQTVQ